VWAVWPHVRRGHSISLYKCGQFYEIFATALDDGGNFDINMNEFAGSVHIRGEVGATYGSFLQMKDIWDGDDHSKYLLGVRRLFTNSQSLKGNYDEVKGPLAD